jgi:hypothetical protein
LGKRLANVCASLPEPTGGARAQCVDMIQLATAITAMIAMSRSVCSLLSIAALIVSHMLSPHSRSGLLAEPCCRQLQTRRVGWEVDSGLAQVLFAA